MEDCSEMMRVMDLLNFKIVTPEEEEDMRSSTSECERYANEVTQQREENTRLRNWNCESEMVIVDLKNRLKVLEKDNETLKGQGAKQKRSHTLATKKLKEGHKQEVKDLKKLLSDKDKAIKSLETTQSKLAGENAKLLQNLSGLETRLRESENMRNSLFGQNKHLNQRLVALTFQSQTNSALISELQKNLNASGLRILALNDENRKWKEDFAKKCKEFEESESKVETMQKTLDSVQTELEARSEKWSEQLNNLEESLSVKEAIIDGVAKDLVKEKREHQDTKEKYKSVSEFMQRMNTDIEKSIETFVKNYCPVQVAPETRVKQENTGQDCEMEESMEKMRLERNLKRLATFVGDTLRELKSSNDQLWDSVEHEREVNYRSERGFAEMLSPGYSNEGEQDMPYLPVVSPVTPETSF